ncbi:MAG: PRC-barrel domain-containing protein, partial [Solirubrobacteraceae bacterium]
MATVHGYLLRVRADECPYLGREHVPRDSSPHLGISRARIGTRRSTMAEHQDNANWNIAEWHGKMLVDRDGEKIGKLQDVYVDVENDEPQFATVKEGFIGRHLTFV